MCGKYRIQVQAEGVVTFLEMELYTHELMLQKHLQQLARWYITYFNQLECETDVT